AARAAPPGTPEGTTSRLTRRESAPITVTVFGSMERKPPKRTIRSWTSALRGTVPHVPRWNETRLTMPTHSSSADTSSGTSAARSPERGHHPPSTYPGIEPAGFIAIRALRAWLPVVVGVGRSGSEIISALLPPAAHQEPGITRAPEAAPTQQRVRHRLWYHQPTPTSTRRRGTSESVLQQRSPCVGAAPWTTWNGDV